MAPPGPSPPHPPPLPVPRLDLPHQAAPPATEVCLFVPQVEGALSLTGASHPSTDGAPPPAPRAVVAESLPTHPGLSGGTARAGRSPLRRRRAEEPSSSPRSGCGDEGGAGGGTLGPPSYPPRPPQSPVPSPHRGSPKRRRKEAVKGSEKPPKEVGRG